MVMPKKYFRDHLVLSLLSANVFLALLAAVLVLVRLGAGYGNAYIVQCRDCSNKEAINKFAYGGVVYLLSYITFAAIVLVANTVLSMRAYRINRQLAVTILSLGVLLLVVTIIVSNALLDQR